MGIIKYISTDQVTATHEAMGTHITLQIFGAREDPEGILQKSCDLIDHFEDILTVNRKPDDPKYGLSEVTRVNDAAGKEPVQVSSAVYGLIKLAVKTSRENFGFNALIGPVVKLWSIGFKGAHVPSDSEIQEKMELIDPWQVDLNDDDHTVFLRKEGMELDLGGIAKGWTADRLRDLWQAYGVEAGIINLGGNVLFVNPCPKRANGMWTVGIQDPIKTRGENITAVMVPECSVVTSGTYERFLEVDGHKYHHLIDPRTGYPVETPVAGVTTFTKNSVDAEIECKRCFFAGKALDHWVNKNRLGAVYVYNDERVEKVGLDY
ncbi:Thiamine biosynthesis protein ApbE [Lactobacillus equicursoris DSM 19284 = JCM 14600 = CIP 110162]|uniref:FAD:protein FMN transferase n=1 Tax=Lactobacillus equicursoris DSM 19284 = JCM 14600 = CIP 110162 TaxID=1293597 RepID=K0NIG9_9LACO|nr:FAD:protein FMN transferase [Lactobacillus equicursoris]KRL03090.1 thiamine biosynthesis protein apbe [Lactobacillus equicursoris DSM 19284 = JCM 14600 = CIP 110162]CCK85052.1 Thiamine biosynthesis protein ApbE [Lactobacillus equicursoris DSM 19284 = JCM 14600 = CIP 110162]